MRCLPGIKVSCILIVFLLQEIVINNELSADDPLLPIIKGASDTCPGLLITAFHAFDRAHIGNAYNA
jgi:hypothetical protein